MAITSQTSNQAANATTSTVTLPASVAAGDLLVVIAGLDVGASTSTNNGGFTELKDETGTDVWVWIGYKIAAGGETSFVLTHTSERSNHIAYRIPAAEWRGSGAPEITAVGDGTSANPDPPSITPSWGAETGTTFIATAILDDSAGASSVSAWPTNYSLNQVTSATATSAASVHAAIRIASSSPENPGTYTVSPSEHWRTYTLAVRGATASGAALAGSFAAIATFGATRLTEPQALAGSFASVATFGANLTVSVPAVLAGSFAAVSSFGASRLVEPQALAGAFAAQSTFGANLRQAAGLAGSFAAVSTFGFANLSVVSSDLHFWPIGSDADGNLIDYLLNGSVKIHTNASRRNGTMAFTLVGPPDVFFVDLVRSEAIIEFTIGGVLFFGGTVRTVTPTDDNPGNVRVKVDCQDYTHLVSDDVADPTVASPIRLTVESDKARIAWLFDTFGLGPASLVDASSVAVVQLVASMPAQDYTGKTLSEALDMICEVSGGEWYVDFDKALHYFASESSTAPFGLSDTPNGTTTFGYTALTVPQDSTESVERVVVLGGDGYQNTYGGSISVETRTAVIRDTKLTSSALADPVAAAYLADHTARVEGSLVTTKVGLEAGMTVVLRSANQHLISDAPAYTRTYRIAALDTTWVRFGQPSFKVSIGDVPRDLAQAIKAVTKAVTSDQAAAIAADVLGGHLDSQVGEMKVWPIATPPLGFVLCNGQSLARVGTYAALFGLIGTTYGFADGTHFNVPNLTGRFLLGVDGSHALAATGGALGHTHTGPSHSHSHDHTGPSHTHSGPSHTHSTPNHEHDVLDHVHSGTTSTNGGALPVAGTGNNRAVEHSHTVTTDLAGSDFSPGTDSSGSGTSGSGGTGSTGSGGTGNTGSDATAGGTGATGAGDPAWLAAYWVIRYTR